MSNYSGIKKTERIPHVVVIDFFFNYRSHRLRQFFIFAAYDRIEFVIVGIVKNINAAALSDQAAERLAADIKIDFISVFFRVFSPILRIKPIKNNVYFVFIRNIVLTKAIMHTEKSAVIPHKPLLYRSLFASL